MAENFDPIFTRARVELTPLDRNALMILQHMNTADFAEFDWVNPDYQPIVDPPLIWSPFNNQLSLSLSLSETSAKLKISNCALLVDCKQLDTVR